MILVYDGVRRVAEEIADALRAAGHEVRVLDTFLGAAALAREVKPDAVVFRADRNSVETARELRRALVPIGVPLVVSGPPWCAYQVFVMGALDGGSDLVWPLTAPRAADDVAAVVARALGARTAVVPAERERRAARARLKRRSGMIAILVVFFGLLLLTVLAPGPALPWVAGRAGWIDVALLFSFSVLAVATAGDAIAAARRGFRLPVAWLAFWAAMVALQVFFVVAR